MKFGSVKLVQNGRFWQISAEPHVKARLKRVFPRAPQEAADHILLSATPENTRELEWFLVRYPMDVDKPEVLTAGADDHRRTEARVQEIITQRRPPPEIPLAVPARGYQLEVPALLDAKTGLLLADDLGTGKTVSAICCIATPEALPAVVVCPPHLQRHWKRMIARFAPALSTHIVKHGTVYPLTAAPRQADLLQEPRLPDVVIITYHRLRTWAETLAPFARTVIYEECQQLRNPDSKIYEACDYLGKKAPRRLGLSATPIFNYGSEFFWVVDVLQPGALGERQEFLREWCVGSFGNKARIANSVEFGAWLRREGIMLRRTRKDIGRELPPVEKVIHEIEADTDVLTKMTGDAVELARTILRRNERFKGEHMKAAGEFDMIMRQATGVAKAPYVAEMVRLLAESGERVLLFGWHRAVYDIWLEKLADLHPVMFTGSESISQREESVSQFLSGQARILIMSLRSGVGLDGLQGKCRIVVFGELDWSPGQHEQCIGRLHRDGQEGNVVAYFMVSDDGADPIMTEVLGIKREQIEGVRNPDAALAQRIDTGENNLRTLAKALLARRGIEHEEEIPATV
jgi:SNF2 family DNA or RNA helicase